ncbi:hypothetical protein SAMN05920897_12713 [Alkalispirochaeta americana]|uniref:Polymerase/histidinol phosphatase N-terminal domain-containing protein n=1 Tax=Alkalispirochaeta americana TaxID=159291 RepID=A0A1N6XMF2_9SPIO|nr:hypothetical protein [Alkalispirochaeta americana]SIR03545.1 hypothetical protein SAMN05920897_12713 [Alkalispirochaeta americana]
MKRTNAFVDEGQWYKGNTHSHTSVSDGTLNPQKLFGLYKELGYDFLSITDHRVFGQYNEYCSGDFVSLPGIELDVLADEEDIVCHHIVGIGTSEDVSFKHRERIDYPEHTRVQDIVDLLIQKNAFIIYAHPAWSRATCESIKKVKGIHAIEVYNHNCEVEAGTGYGEWHYDQLLESNRMVYPIGTDDSHQKQMDFGGGWIMVKSVELSRASIISAMQRGSFYASQGPSIHEFYVSDDIACIECSPVRTICFQANGMPGDAVSANDGDWKDLKESDGVTQHQYKLSGGERYIRAIITDLNGNKAWTPALILD